MKTCSTLFIFGMLIGLLQGCHERDPKTASITGTLVGNPGFKLIIGEMEPLRFRPVDSAIIGSDGHFKFNITPVQPGFWYLQAASGKVYVTEIHPGDNLVLRGSTVDFPDRIVTSGSSRAETIDAFFRQTRRQERMADSLEAILMEFQDSTIYADLTIRFDSMFRTIWERQREFEIRYIRENPTSLSSLIVLNYAFGMSPVLDMENDQAYYRMLDSSLSAVYPGNPHVLYHRKRLQDYRVDEK